MKVHGLDHYTINASDVDASTAFYGDVLSLEKGWRPAFTFPGAWLYCGEQPTVHLIGGREATGPGTGSINHVAFRATGADAFKANLDSKGIAHNERSAPGTGLLQVFVTDPDGIVVEINFPGEAKDGD